MPQPDIAGQTAVAVAWATAGGFLLKAVEFVFKQRAVKKTLENTDIGRTVEIGSAMREELRKDNEALRDRVADVESRLERLEYELHEAKRENDFLRAENEGLKVQLKAAR